MKHLAMFSQTYGGRGRPVHGPWLVSRLRPVGRRSGLVGGLRPVGSGLGLVRSTSGLVGSRGRLVRGGSEDGLVGGRGGGLVGAGLEVECEEGRDVVLEGLLVLDDLLAGDDALADLLPADVGLVLGLAGPGDADGEVGVGVVGGGGRGAQGEGQVGHGVGELLGIRSKFKISEY